jgi:hypothetical protein
MFVANVSNSMAPLSLVSGSVILFEISSDSSRIVFLKADGLGKKEKLIFIFMIV